MIGADVLGNLFSYSAQLACIVAAGAVLPGLLRLHATDARYAYWRALVVLCLALPWLQAWRTAHGVEGAVTASVVETIAASSAAAVAAPQGFIDWSGAVVFVLAAGAAFRLVWLTAGVIQLRRRRRAGTPAAQNARHDELQRMLGTRADIRYVADLRQPVTFGLLRPVVLLPESVRNHSAEIQEAVLTHELCHVQRRDWAWVLLEEVLRAAFWFHPGMWWLISRVQLAREELVDELSVLVTGRRRTYVEALLTFADTTPLAPAPAFARRRHLFHRMLLISREVSMSSRRIVASCAVMAALVVISGWYAVSAFPLRQSTLSSDVVWSNQPGPLERQARPITPENPIPRRIAYVAPIFPADVTDARGVITLRLTIDDVGRVAETRLRSFVVSTKEFTMNMSDVSLWTLRNKLPADMAKEPALAILEAFSNSADHAARQWRYDPPAEAPLAFDVTLNFGAPPPPPPPPPQPARMRNTPGMPPPPPSAPPASRIEEMGFVPSESSRTADGALRIGGAIKPPEKVRDVRPVYPAIAKAAGVQGVVIVEIRIETDGRVSDARILRSIPLLDEAALDAVRQWMFTPTLLNGVPTPIIMTTTLNFRME